MAQPARSDSGFTLPEVIVAAGILSSALVALAGLFTLSLQSDFESRTRTIETVLAQQKVEELLADADGSSVPPSAGTEYLDIAGSPAAAGRAVFARRWSVDGLPDAPDAAVIVRVEVTRRTVSGIHDNGVRLVTVTGRRTL
jgi:prepilin-type N-terminal cleavage/methylation domain-containing protein